MPKQVFYKRLNMFCETGVKCTSKETNRDRLRIFARSSNPCFTWSKRHTPIDTMTPPPADEFIWPAVTEQKLQSVTFQTRRPYSSLPNTKPTFPRSQKQKVKKRHAFDQTLNYLPVSCAHPSRSPSACIPVRLLKQKQQMRRGLERDYWKDVSGR